MSTKIDTETVTTKTTTTTCDRCTKLIGEVVAVVSPDPLDIAAEPVTPPPPALVIMRHGAIVFSAQDLDQRCQTTCDNYIRRISKDPDPEPEPAAPVDPGALRWVPDNEEWVCGVGEDLRAYSHTEAPDRAAGVIPALEGVTDPAEAGALIAAYEEPAVRWDDGAEGWVTDAGKVYSYKENSFPELEGVTDAAAAGALIAEHEAGGPSDR